MLSISSKPSSKWSLIFNKLMFSKRLISSMHTHFNIITNVKSNSTEYSDLLTLWTIVSLDLSMAAAKYYNISIKYLI